MNVTCKSALSANRHSNKKQKNFFQKRGKTKMKRSMKKFMTTCAAVTAIAAVASVSAMAAEYTAETNSATYAVPTPDQDTQMTVIVVPEDKVDAITDEDIYYINQDGTLSGNALLKGTELADGTYVVRVGYYEGGEFKIAEEKFTVGDVIVNPPVGTTVKVGDADQNNRISTNDAAKVLSHTSKLETLEGLAFKAAALSDNNDRISTNDAAEILKFTSKFEVDYVNKDVEVTAE